MRINITELSKTEMLGRVIADYLTKFQGLAIFYLDGDLGTGKTTLVREVLKSLGLLFARPSAWADKARLFAARGGARAPHACEQRAGDVVYVPSLWYHATLNDGDALALGVQQTGHWTSEAHMRALFGRYPNISYVRYARAEQEFFALLAQNPAAPATARTSRSRRTASRSPAPASCSGASSSR